MVNAPKVWHYEDTYIFSMACPIANGMADSEEDSIMPKPLKFENRPLDNSDQSVIKVVINKPLK